jgi:phage shock protein PspC (stress-responsive transcriptional regulator)
MLEPPPQLVSALDTTLLVLVLWALYRGIPRRGQPCLYRPVDGRMLSGVCLAIGRRLGIHADFVRIGFLVALALGAHAILAYIAIEIVLAWDPAERDKLWARRLWLRMRARRAG